MSKHTPGPWSVYCYVEPKGYVQEIGPIQVNTFFSEDDDTYYPYLEIEEADAKLIAAAPELLAALKAIVCGLSKEDEEGLLAHTEQIVKAQKAIAKAEGIT
jgi:hypothetical protein